MDIFERERFFKNKEMKTKHDLTLSSNILVNMTIVGTRCSQIIRQKSSTELSVGPVINNYTAAC